MKLLSASSVFCGLTLTATTLGRRFRDDEPIEVRDRDLQDLIDVTGFNGYTIDTDKLEEYDYFDIRRVYDDENDVYKLKLGYQTLGIDNMIVKNLINVDNYIKKQIKKGEKDYYENEYAYSMFYKWRQVKSEVYSNKHWKISDDSLTWSEAQMHCQTYKPNGRLVEPSNQMLLSELKDLIINEELSFNDEKNNNIKDISSLEYFIGAKAGRIDGILEETEWTNDETNQWPYTTSCAAPNYKWLSKSFSVNMNFFDEASQNFMSDEKKCCVTTSKEGTLKSEKCEEEKRKYICEIFD